ncbi:uncharacterized protein RAG0_06398 [Rhynchosporium agropyri]|uniref:Uncharacterized protein n=1 Tax=Rhynchosporium agropyri TaxID=914238 RepID=A0A1E1KGX2_9HELO|nr:uncharacterized protein RAG0_06398 [Rhynchosporium agropyri]
MPSSQDRQPWLSMTLPVLALSPGLVNLQQTPCLRCEKMWIMCGIPVRACRGPCADVFGIQIETQKRAPLEYLRDCSGTDTWRQTHGPKRTLLLGAGLLSMNISISTSQPAGKIATGIGSSPGRLTFPNGDRCCWASLTVSNDCRMVYMRVCGTGSPVLCWCYATKITANSLIHLFCLSYSTCLSAFLESGEVQETELPYHSMSWYMVSVSSGKRPDERTTAFPIELVQDGVARQAVIEERR